jgi:hypothetical protein
VRVVALSITAALAVLVGAAGALGSSSNATAGSRSITFRLIEKDVAFNFVDNPPRQGVNAPPLLGDQFAFSSELLTRSMARAGSLQASCVVTTGGVKGLAECTGLFLLKGGTLALMGPANITEDGGADHIAVVGGTGVYEGVTGSILSISRGENSPFSDDTIHLIWP